MHVVNSTNAKGKSQWVATFAQQTTAETFVRQMNRIYAGHLTFKIGDK